MKVSIKIKELTHDDLVDLFSTGLTGSSIFGFNYTIHDKPELPLKEDDCIEDIMAKILLAGHKVTIIDYYAEGELYSSLGTGLDDEYNGLYEIGLEDIIKGLEKAGENHDPDFPHDALTNYIDSCMDSGCSFDLTDGESLIQMICFGELVYG
jgi:hypothetical protein